MPVSSNALKCLPACKNQLCDNMIDKEFEESGNDTADKYESDNISGVAIMHKNKEISFLYTQSVLTDCLSLPDI